MPEHRHTPAFGLYVHWPYCEAKCPYCDFNSHVERRIDHDAWREAYVRDIRNWAADTDPNPLSSVYFGGGTPSLMEPETVAAVLEAAHRAWGFTNDIEITLEANPGSVEASRFTGYAAAGVNRVSLGLQALDDAHLRMLGRIHSVAEGLEALTIAQNTFSRVSFDLICARQHQSLSDWEAELSRALALGTDHLSLYQLTIEPGTAFGNRLASGRLIGLPDEDLAVDFYELTQDLCAAAGLPAYEVSNHARPGQESRHNLIYWQGYDYVGVGPGAHGRISSGGTRLATEASRSPQTWLKNVASGSRHTRQVLTSVEQAEEYLMMGLRTIQGIDKKRFSSICGRCFDPESLAELQSLDMIDETDSRIFVTDSGRLVLNAIIPKLLLV